MPFGPDLHRIVVSSHSFPTSIRDESQLDDLLSTPAASAVAAMQQVEGDVLVLGAGGKMGPTLARMAKRAADAADTPRRVIAVSRFSKEGDAEALIEHGVEVIRGDLLDDSFFASLPDVPNVLFLAGAKFGTADNPSTTWATNVLLPAAVCRRFCHSRTVAFSTGNVYPMVAPDTGGSVEDDPLQPVGEYAITAMGRERVFEHFSRTLDIPIAIIRLNYAVEMRYGVLLDLAECVYQEQPVDLSMGFVNVIWQGDANAMSLAALAHAARPPEILNVAGPEILRVRDVCRQFATLLGKQVHFTGTEADTAFLSNSAKCVSAIGSPQVAADQLISWVADWVGRRGPTLKKPTHFQVRDGSF